MNYISVCGSFHQFPFPRDREVETTQTGVRTNEETRSPCEKIEKVSSLINIQKSSDLELISLKTFADEISQKRGYQPVESTSSQNEIFTSSNSPKYTNNSYTNLIRQIMQTVSKEMQKDEKGNHLNIKEESYLELCSLKSFAEKLIEQRNQNF